MKIMDTNERFNVSGENPDRFRLSGTFCLVLTVILGLSDSRGPLRPSVSVEPDMGPSNPMMPPTSSATGRANEAA
jgi:hypothetical protein